MQENILVTLSTGLVEKEKQSQLKLRHHQRFLFFQVDWRRLKIPVKGWNALLKTKMIKCMKLLGSTFMGTF